VFLFNTDKAKLSELRPAARDRSASRSGGLVPVAPWPLHLNSFPPKQRHVFPEREEWLEKSPSCFAPPTHTAAAAAALLSAEPAKLPTRGEVSANSNRAHSRLRGPAGPGRPARAPAPLGFLRARCSWSALNEKVTAMSRLL